MSRRVFKIQPGWHGFIRNGEIETFHTEVHYLELLPDDIYLGAWNHHPTPDEVAEVVRVVTQA